MDTKSNENRINTLAESFDILDEIIISLNLTKGEEFAREQIAQKLAELSSKMDSASINNAKRQLDAMTFDEIVENQELLSD